MFLMQALKVETIALNDQLSTSRWEQVCFRGGARCPTFGGCLFVMFFPFPKIYFLPSREFFFNKPTVGISPMGCNVTSYKRMSPMPGAGAAITAFQPGLLTSTHVGSKRRIRGG